MTGMPGRSGRKTFVPTPEQRKNVKALAGSGMPQEQICQLVINPQTDKPLDEKSLRKHFKREIATGEIELHALIDNFMITTILGVAPPAGARAIDNQHARAALLTFFVKTRMGRKESAVNRHKDHVGGAIEDQGKTNIRQEIMDKIERLRQARETEGSSPCPSGKEPDAT
jgi:hypothetical protein